MLIFLASLFCLVDLGYQLQDSNCLWHLPHTDAGQTTFDLCWSRYAPQQEHSMQEHRAPLRESSNLNVLKVHDQANFIHWIAWDKTACFREEHRHSLWTLFLRKSSSCKLSMPFPTAGGWERACLHCDALGHERHLAARWALHLHCCLHSANT